MNTRREQKARIEVEALEDRQLLAASVTLAAGKVLVQGTDQADHVRVMQRGRRILVQASLPGEATQQYSFSRSRVRSVEFHGGIGDDTFVNNSDVRGIAFGDEGNDYLRGGRGRDEIHGGVGDDYINGGAGRDDLFGDDGLDHVSGSRDDHSEGMEIEDHHGSGRGESHSSVDSTHVSDDLLRM